MLTIPDPAPAPAPVSVTAAVEQKFENGIDALLLAAQTVETDTTLSLNEPPAKKQRVEHVKKEYLTKKTNYKQPVPILIKPALAAFEQIQKAIRFSQFIGMPDFEYTVIENPTQYELAIMYREQLTEANTYIDMAIKKFSDMS